MPVIIDDREGQHIGEVTNALTNSAPSRKIFRVLFIDHIDPSATSWSSVNTKIILGRLDDRLAVTTITNINVINDHKAFMFVDYSPNCENQRFKVNLNDSQL